MKTPIPSAGEVLSELGQALGVIDDVQSLIHAGWMAAGALDRGDHAAEQDALRAVLNLASEHLCRATDAIRRAQSGRATA